MYGKEATKKHNSISLLLTAYVRVTRRVHLYVERNRARRRIDTGHVGWIHSREHARGHVQPRCRGGGGEGAVAATAAAAARRRVATHTSRTVTPPRSAPARGGRGGRHGARMGGWSRPPRDGAPLTASVDGVSNRRRAAATKAGTQARSPADYRESFEPR